MIQKSLHHMQAVLFLDEPLKSGVCSRKFLGSTVQRERIGISIVKTKAIRDMEPSTT